MDKTYSYNTELMIMSILSFTISSLLFYYLVKIYEILWTIEVILFGFFGGLFLLTSIILMLLFFWTKEKNNMVEDLSAFKFGDPEEDEK